LRSPCAPPPGTRRNRAPDRRPRQRHAGTTLALSPGMTTTTTFTPTLTLTAVAFLAATLLGLIALAIG